MDKSATVSPAMLGKFKWAQLVTSTLSFIVPALLFGYYSSPKALPYVGLQKTVAPILIIAAAVLLFCIQPFIGWLGNMNATINFGAMHQQLVEQEALYNRALQVFLQMKTGGDLLINLFIMALLPAVGEELFFRGALQKGLMRLSNRPWFAILTSSIVFALLHGTYFKLLPIFALGVVLGIVYYVTRNLWYCIIIHFINNAFAVFAVYYANRSETLRNLANDNIRIPIYLAIVSLAITVGILYFIKRKSDEVMPATMLDDEPDIA